MNKKYFALLLMLVGAVGAVLFSFYVVDGIVNADPCYYDLPEHKASPLFELFYDFPVSEGYHATPSMFNLFFSFIIGALPGWQLLKYFRKQGRAGVA
jgi:hypothetical protein